MLCVGEYVIHNFAPMININSLYLSLTKLYYFFQAPLFNKFALPPLQAFFDVTYRCNLRCNMCHSLSLIEDSAAPDNNKKELTAEQIIKIIRQLPRNTLITFTGGEPFLRKDMVDILTSTCKNYKCHIITNGTLIDEETANSLIELRVRSLITPGLMMIGVSLEGPEEIHDEIAVKKGSFQKTISAIKLIQKKKEQLRSRYPMIHLTTVITSRSVPHLNFIYSLAKDLRLDYCNFVLENTSVFSRDHQVNNFSPLYQSPISPSKIDPELLRSQLERLEGFASHNSTPKIRFSPVKISHREIVRYYSTGLNPKDYRCYAPWVKIGFSAFGDVICCPHIKIGNTLESKYDTLWNSLPYKTFRKKLKKEKSFPGCLGCCYSEYVGRK